jgi:putative lipase involved disintegration of autophagic bodies
MKNFALFILLQMYAAVAFSQSIADPIDPSLVSREIASKYALHAMLSSNSYHNEDRVKFAVENLGWIQVDRNGKSTSKPTFVGKVTGLAYDVFEKKDANETIIAFRGTDNKRDYLTANLAPWPFSIQYTAARKVVRLYSQKNPKKKVTVTGHSLGGSLALSASVRLGVDAVVFDSSPRIFDGLGDKHEPAARVMIYEAGEILEVVRKVWPKIYTAVPRENVFKGSFDFGGVSKHRSDYLALGLLRLGAEVDPSLVGVLKLLPK